MFRDRQEAGELLAQKLKKVIRDPTESSGHDFVVVALLRGGIVLGKKIADYFKIPLAPLAVRKIGAPLNSELAIGAVTFDNTHYFDEDLIRYLDVDQEYIKNSLENKRKEAQTLQKKFKSKNSLRDKRVVIVDDGIATGATAICASIYAKKEQAEEIILATPLIAKDSLRNIKSHFDRIISLKIVDHLVSVSQFYKSFPQITDEEAISYLL